MEFAIYAGFSQYILENGFETKVITSDWLHMHKTVRENCPQRYEMVHVKPYTFNYSIRQCN